MKKKIIGVCVIGLFLLSAFNVIGVNTDIDQNNSINLYNLPLDDNLDQFQLEYDYESLVLGTFFIYAQSFKPTYSKLSKIELLIWMNIRGVSDEEIKVSIKNRLYGKELTSISMSRDSLERGYSKWYSFDFEDINVIPNKTYYIVIDQNPNVLTIDFYDLVHLHYIELKYKSDEGYTRGEFWLGSRFPKIPFFTFWLKNIFFKDGDLYSRDFCFKTYGYD